MCLYKQTCVDRTLRAAIVIAALYLPTYGALTDLSLAAGPMFEYNFYGQLGARITIADNNLLHGHPQAMLSYTTSRASWWNGPYDLVIDDILLCPSWHFKPGRLIDPFVGIDVGFLRFNKDNDAIFALLKNKFVRFNFRAGVHAALLEGRLQPSIDVGYVILENSATFPLFYSLAVCYQFVKGAPR